MVRYVALVRAVNVGGRGKVAMAELRGVFEELGFTDVGTYIQSGNVVFSSEHEPVVGADLEAALAARLGLETTVVVRTAEELDEVVAACPFPDVEASKLHVAFMPSEPEPGVAAGFDAEPFHPEEVVIRGREAYLHLPNGVGRSKLPASVERHVGVPTTVRGWKTVTKLLDLARSDRAGA